MYSLSLTQILCITTVLATASAVHFKKLQYEMDDLIDSLLKSDKFESLAEQIAIRAAQKALAIQSHKTGPKNKNNNQKNTTETNTQRFESLKNSDIEEDDTVPMDPSERIFTFRALENSDKQLQTYNKNNERRKLKFDIDADATMKKMAMMPNKNLELSLNYNRFTVTEATTYSHTKKHKKVLRMRPVLVSEESEQVNDNRTRRSDQKTEVLKEETDNKTKEATSDSEESESDSGGDSKDESDDDNEVAPNKSGSH